MSTMTTFPSGYAMPRGEAAPRKSLFRRFVDRMIEARTRKAEEFVRQHSHLIPRDMERAGWQVTERSEDSLPFMR